MGVATATLLTGACSIGTAQNSAAGTTRTIDAVGRVAGSDALVAVVAAGDRIDAYVCDGPSVRGDRFTGTLTGDHAELRSASGATMIVDLAGSAATGTVTPKGGAPAGFTTTPSTDAAGLYIADGQSPAGAYTTGWVVLADGTQTGTTQLRNHRAPAPSLRIHKPHTTLPAAKPTKGSAGTPSRRGKPEAPAPSAPGAPPTKEVANGPTGVSRPPADPDAPPTKEVANGPTGVSRTFADSEKAEATLDGIGVVPATRLGPDAISSGTAADFAAPAPGLIRVPIWR